MYLFISDIKTRRPAWAAVFLIKERKTFFGLFKKTAVKKAAKVHQLIESHISYLTWLY
jgi:hypothetical protein